MHCLNDKRARKLVAVVLAQLEFPVGVRVPSGKAVVGH